MGNDTKNLPSVTLGSIRKMIKKLEGQDDSTELSMEFILTAFFPKAWNNIKKYSNDCYTEGYLAGLKESKKINQGN